MTIDEARRIVSEISKKLVMQFPATRESIEEETKRQLVVVSAFAEHPLFYWYAHSMVRVLADIDDEKILAQMQSFMSQCFYLGYEAGRQNCIDIEVDRMLKANER
jgi:hypothetical protein